MLTLAGNIDIKDSIKQHVAYVTY